MGYPEMSKPEAAEHQQSAAGGSMGSGALVRTLFSLFETNDVTWAVLRGSEGLPDFTRYDIDLLVAPSDLKRAEVFLDEAAGRHGWHKIGVIRKYHYRCHLLVSSGPQRRFLPIDLFAGCNHRFYEIADATYALAHRQRVKDCIWVVPAGFGAVVTILKELMYRDRFKENSRHEVRKGALEDPESFVRTGRAWLGDNLTRRLLRACQEDDWEQVESLASEIRRQVWRQRPKRLLAAAAFAGRAVLHHLRPPMSMLVALLGPDGVGKTTVADHLCERLFQRPFKVCRHFEYNFHILPKLKHLRACLGRLLGRRIEVKQPPQPGTKGSAMNPEHPTMGAMAYVLYYAVDLLLGHLVVAKLRGQSGLIVFARYFHDYYFQKGYRNAPRWFLRLLESLIPSPDLIVCLHRNPSEIYAAKPELDLVEIEAQQELIRATCATRPNAVVIDGSEGVDKTVERVADAVVSALLARKGIR